MMKVILLVALLAYLSSAYPQENGCIFIDGVCSSYCPDGTHGYSVGCDIVMTQPTCENPISEPMEGIICDLSRCDCNEPTVLDTRSDKCVLIEDCPIVAEPKPEGCLESGSGETDTKQTDEITQEQPEPNEEKDEENHEKPDSG